MRSDVAPLPNTIGTPAATALLTACSRRRRREFLPPVSRKSVCSSEIRSSTVGTKGSFFCNRIFAPVSVASHFQSQPVRLVHDRFDLFQSQRRAVDQGAVRLPHVNRADKILGC